MKTCPFCAEEIRDEAIVCKHCHSPLTAEAQAAIAPVATRPAPSNGVAAVLSLVIPGAGQMYKGHLGVGILWLVLVPIGYLSFILPGLVLHLLCIITAAGSAPSPAPTTRAVAATATPVWTPPPPPDPKVVARQRRAGRWAFGILGGLILLTFAFTIIYDRQRRGPSRIGEIERRVDEQTAAKLAAETQLRFTVSPGLTAIRIANDSGRGWSRCSIEIGSPRRYEKSLGDLAAGVVVNAKYSDFTPTGALTPLSAKRGIPVAREGLTVRCINTNGLAATLEQHGAR